jgi:hypothetical protein
MVLSLMMPSINNITYNILGGRRIVNVAKDIFYFFPECDYIMTFDSYVKNWANNSLPEFVTFDPENKDGDWFTVDLEDTGYEGSHFDIILRVNILDPEEDYSIEHYHSNVVNSRYILWTIDMTYFPYIPPNIAPKFESMIKRNFHMFLGESMSYSTGIPSNDTVNVEITWTPKSLSNFMTHQIDK